MRGKRALRQAGDTKNRNEFSTSSFQHFDLCALSTMATLIRSLSKCHRFLHYSVPLQVTRGAKTMANVELTLDVKRRIDSTRQQALLGGGQRRIDVQHKKVRLKRVTYGDFTNYFPCLFNVCFFCKIPFSPCSRARHDKCRHVLQA